MRSLVYYICVQVLLFEPIASVVKFEPVRAVRRRVGYRPMRVRSGVAPLPLAHKRGRSLNDPRVAVLILLATRAMKRLSPFGWRRELGPTNPFLSVRGSMGGVLRKCGRGHKIFAARDPSPSGAQKHHPPETLILAAITSHTREARLHRTLTAERIHICRITTSRQSSKNCIA